MCCVVIKPDRTQSAPWSSSPMLHLQYTVVYVDVHFLSTRPVTAGCTCDVERIGVMGNPACAATAGFSLVSRHTAVVPPVVSQSCSLTRCRKHSSCLLNWTAFVKGQRSHPRVTWQGFLFLLVTGKSIKARSHWMSGLVLHHWTSFSEFSGCQQSRESSRLSQGIRTTSARLKEF